MGFSLLALVNPGNGTTATSIFVPANANILAGITTTPRAKSESPIGVAATWGAVGSGTQTSVVANNVGTVRHVKSSKNGVAGTIDVTCTNTTAGTYVDNTHSDSLAVDDLFGFNFSSTGTPTYESVVSALLANANHATVAVAACTGNALGNTSNRFGAIGGDCSNYNATENLVRIPVRQAARANRLSIDLSANSATGAVNFSLRKNNATVNNSISVGAGATGQFTDTTHTDDLVSGDFINYIIPTLSGIQPWTACNTSLTLETRDGSAINDIFFAANLGASHPNPTAFGAIIGFAGGGSGTTTTEANVKLAHGFSVAVSRFRINVGSNATTATTTFRSRVNGANGNLTFPVGSGATGQFEDTTHADILAATDQYNWTMTSSDSTNSIGVYAGAFTENSAPFVPFFYGSMSEDIATVRDTRLVTYN